MRALEGTVAEPTIFILTSDLANDYDKLAEDAALESNSLLNDNRRYGGGDRNA